MHAAVPNEDILALRIQGGAPARIILGRENNF